MLGDPLMVSIVFSLGGERVDNVDAIKNYVEGFFRNLYSDDKPLRSKVDGLVIPCLGEGLAEWLERPFSEEVKKVVWFLDGDKALWPDGFTLAFYKACWDVIQTDLMLVEEVMPHIFL